MKLNELLLRTKQKMMVENYSLDTIDSYISVIGKFFDFLARRPDAISLDHTRRMEMYLTWRVVDGDVSPSTQNVDFCALLYLGRNVLMVDVGKVDALRAKRRDRIPHIINPSQVAMLLDALPEEYRLIARLLYGAGLRINECLNLRIKDVDLSICKLIIHEGKGNKDGIVPIPSTLIDDLQKQTARATDVWKDDRYHKYNGVSVPNALARKYPNAPTSKDWFWLFPNPSLGYDNDGVQRRYHVYDFAVQKSFVATRRKLGLPEFVSPHSMRHFFATHFLQHLLGQGIPESMARSKLMEYLRHASSETMDWYVHLAMPENAMIKSPIDLLVLSNRVG